VTDGFVRAGEGYFSPDGKKIIFQAEEKDTGNPFYQIFVQELDTGKFRRIESSADTKRQPVADQWQSFIFDNHERQPVRQNCLPWRRNRDRSRW